MMCLSALAWWLTAVPLRAQETRDLRGRILSPDSTGVAGVTVLLLGQGRDSTFSSADGTFMLRGVRRDAVRLAVRNFAIYPDTIVAPAGQDTVTVWVRMRVIALPTFEVQGVSEPVALRRFERTAQISTTSLDSRELVRAPGLFEPDVVRAVQLLPGTVAKNDFSIGYNVRGGEADQNLVLLDGMPLFNPSHLGGLFSTFDANAVRRADFYAGGFPSWYSGRLSSVLDVSLDPGDPVEFRGQGQISLLSSKVLLQGPVAGGTYIGGLRRTYADAVVAAFTQYELPYYFTDAVAKLTFHPGGDGLLSISGYWGRDALDYEIVKPNENQDGVRLALGWGNRVGGVTWRTPLGRNGFVEAQGGVSEFSTTLGLLPSIARFDNEVRLGTARITVAPDSGDAHDPRLGIGVESYRMSYLATSEALEATLFEQYYRPTVWSAFANDTWFASRALMLRPGLRLEYVTGADRFTVSPRMSTKLFVAPRTAILASAGRYYQAIHSIRDQELPVSVFEFWIGADQFVPVAHSDQVVLGVERWFGEAVQVSVEGWGKTFTNLVTPNRADDPGIEGDEFVPTDGTAWGVDVLLRKHIGWFTGWIAYGFAKAVRTADGVEFPPAHDRRHTLNAVAFFPGPLGAEMSVRWGYGSPLPYTGLVGQWDHRRYDATNQRFDDYEDESFSSTINGQRYPPYSRLDVSLRWDMERWGMRWQPYLQVANVYNRLNVFLYYTDYGASPPTRTGVSQLPLLPTFGIEVAF